jgi:hypothetical protein
MLYHQTEKGNHDTRLTVLKNVKGKYKWNAIVFPVSYTDIKNSENLNQVCINVWGITEENTVHPLRLGTLSYVKNDTLNLLLLHDGDEGHYVYLKNWNIFFVLLLILSTKIVNIVLTVQRQFQ